jgi:hypothetical protein
MLKAIRLPDIEKVHCLCRDNVTNHGATESIDATDAPNPNSTSSEGNAQQNRVLRDVNSDK